MPKLSIVATLYSSAPYIEEFWRRATEAACRLTDDFEIVLVNDGSPDDSLDRAVALHEKDARVRVIDLSRNFGHHRAIMVGLTHARGELVFLLDSDLEEDPELLTTFHAMMLSSSADVVYGIQETRKGRFFERIAGSVFYTLLNLLSPVQMPRNVVTARLMTRRYVENLVLHDEREVFLLGLCTITGFEQLPIVVQKHDKGLSSYRLRHKLDLLVNSITSFSNKPLVLIFYLGSAILGLSAVAAADLIVRRLFFGTLLSGWPSLIVSIWLLGGLTIFCLGVIGIYMAKIFIEVKRRPYAVVRRVYERGAATTSQGREE